MKKAENDRMCGLAVQRCGAGSEGKSAPGGLASETNFPSVKSALYFKLGLFGGGASNQKEPRKLTNQEVQ